MPDDEGTGGRSARRIRKQSNNKLRPFEKSCSETVVPGSGEPKQLDQTKVLVKHAKFYELNEAQPGSAVKHKTRNYTSLPQPAKLKRVDHEAQPAIGPEQQNEEDVGRRGRRKAAPGERGKDG